jgi:superfamily II DNA or RNA helicase
MNSIQLRDYQDDLAARTGAALRRARRVLVVLPPGGGKTVIAAFMAQRFAGRNQSTYFNCHRSELLQQTSLTFQRVGLTHGYIAAGFPMMRNQLVQVCSIDTLKRRLASTPAPRAVLWDECHHIGAEGWSAIMNAWPETYHIGLTGTPWRLDGTGLGKYFDEMVEGPTTAELIAMGNLSDYKLFAPPGPDMNGVGKVAGDFRRGEAAERMNKPKLTGDMIEHWRKHANGLRTVGYAVNVAHSQHLAGQFSQAGIPAVHLDGDTPTADRKRIVQEFASGHLRVLFNVDLFGEGFDLSAIAQRDVTIDAGILARPTWSLSLFLQQAMRPMRPAPGKVAVILDHAGNTKRHGLPDDEREWSLDGRKKGNRADNDNGPSPPVDCPGCFRQLRRPLPPRCPSCGHKFDDEQPREIEVADVELVESDEVATRRAERQARVREEVMAKTLDELVALGKSRNYRFPMQWAQKKFGARALKRQSNHAA